MKTAGRLLALLLVALTLAATLGCSLMPTTSNGGGSNATKAQTTVATTAEQTAEAKEDDLLEIRTLYQNLFAALVKSETAVVYDDPAIGTKLRASSTLTKDGETYTYQAKVDRLNPADAERFVSEETLDPVVGTVEEIRADYAGLFLWARVATGLVLSVPAFEQDSVSSPILHEGDGETTLTAGIPDDRQESFFGFALSGVTGMEIAVAYTETAIRSLTISYTQNDVPVTVTVTYTY